MRRTALVLLAAVLPSCGGDSPSPAGGGTAGAPQAPRGFEPPVVINAESPVRYPPDLFRARVEGTVVLRLFVTAEGELVSDSTRIAESSGQPALDTAALRGAEQMQFAPARRDGTPVPTTFLQPVHFRHPAGAAPGGLQ